MIVPDETIFQRVTTIARETILRDLADFLADNPKWSETKLLKASGVDPGLLTRIRQGASFQTRTADKLQETMEAVIEGRLRLGTTQEV